MPSKTTQHKMEQSIPCRLIGGDIPVHICVTQQHADACKGCTASTRRCTSCGKTQGIALAKLGLCERCAKRDKQEPEHETNERETIPLERLIDRVQSIGQPTGVLPLLKTTNTQQQVAMTASPLLKKPEALYKLLAEHAARRNDAWLVRSPMAILRTRRHLLPSECEEILESLKKKNFIQGQKPWEEVSLLKTEGIEQMKEAVELSSRRVIGTKREHTRSIYVPPQKSVGTKNPTANVASTKPLVAPKAIPRMQCGPTYGEIYEHLVKKSSIVGEERLLGGALPALQIRFKLSVQEAKAALEWFVEQGHIVQKDGWRSIVLRATSVESTDSPKQIVAQPPLRLVPRQEADVAQKAPSPPRSRTIPAVVTEKKRCAQPLNSDASINDMVEQLERDLPLLREHRDAVMQKVSALELALLSMKAIQQQGGSEGIAQSSLKDATKAAQELLSALHKKNA